MQPLLPLAVHAVGAVLQTGAPLTRLCHPRPYAPTARAHLHAAWSGKSGGESVRSYGESVRGGGESVKSYGESVRGGG